MNKRYCLPQSMFNSVPYPLSGTEETGLDGICREVAYKLPGAEEVMVRKEAWHAVCDFCTRTGAYMKRYERGADDAAGEVTLDLGGDKLLWLTRAEVDGSPTSAFSVSAVAGGAAKIRVIFSGDEVADCAVVAAVRPAFDDQTVEGGKWSPKVPQYVIDRYGECITHGALMRLYAMRGEMALAQMHATAYNEDLLRHSYGLITSGMRKHLMVDLEDVLALAQKSAARGGAA